MVASDHFDPNSTPGNDSTDEDDDVTVTLPMADLSVTKSVVLATDPSGDLDGSGTITVGDIVDFTVTVNNAGPDLATGVIVTDQLPNGFAYLSDSSGGNYDFNNGQWNVGAIAAGDSKSIVIRASVTASGNYTNVAQMTASGTYDPDSTPNNNEPDEDDYFSITTTLGLAADLELDKVITGFIDVDNSGGLSDGDGANIQDIFPAELLSPSYVSIPSGGATGNTSGSGNINDTVNMPVGSQILYIVSATVAPTASGTLSNTATVSPPSGVTDPNPGNNLSTDTNTILEPPTADVGVLKNFALTTDADGSGSVTAGDTVTFAITVFNIGPDQATGVTVQDVVPSGYNNIQNITGGGLLSGNTITWSGLSLSATPGLNSLTLTFNATVTSTRNYTNPVQIIASNQIDPNPDNNQASVTPVVQLVSDLSLAKSVVLLTDADNSGNISAGDTMRFSVILSNAGPDGVTGAVVTDNLPLGYLGAVNVSGGGIYSAVNRTITWSGLNVAANSSTTLTFDTVILNGFEIEDYSNFAEVTSSPNFDPDSTPGNGSGVTPVEDDEASTRPAMSDLSLTKDIALINDADSSGGYSGGDTVQFTLTVSNAGPDAANNVGVQDILPAGYNWLSGGSYNPVNRIITWSGVNVPSGGNATLTFTATLVAGLPLSAYNNYAQIATASNFDPNSVPGDNSVGDDDDAMAAPPISNLSLVKSVDLVNDILPLGTINDGDTIRFTLTVTNSGPDEATGVDVEDVLPDGFTDVASINLDGSYDSGTGIVSWSNLTVPASSSLELTFEVLVAATGSYTNYAQISGSDNFDTNSTPGNDSTTEDDDDTLIITPFIRQPPVAVDDQSLANPPGAVTLSVTDNDSDPNDDLDVSTVDLDPSTPGLQDTLVVTGEGTWTVDNLGNVTFTPEELSPGVFFSNDPTPIPYTVQDHEGNVANPATVTVLYDPPVVLGDADVHISKIDCVTSVGAGYDTVYSYMITVTNDGPYPAEGVIVTDQWPSVLTLLSMTFDVGSVNPLPNGNFQWLIGSLDVGEAVELTVTYTVNAGASGAITNTVTVSALNDPDTDNNTASDTNTVGTLFLQGTSFIDGNGNAMLDPGEAYKPNAPILLYHQVCDGDWLLIGQTTTNANGYYIFEDLAPGNYRIQEGDVSSLGYVSSGTQIRSDVYDASQLNFSTIQVALVDPLTARFAEFGGTQNVTVQRYGVRLGPMAAGQLVFQVSNDGTNFGDEFFTFCIDLYHDLLAPVIDFDVVPETTPRFPGLATNIGRIGYLLNQYGSTQMTPTYASALQLALWELVYDEVPNLSSGNFRVVRALSSTSYWANWYLQQSVGKYEAVMFLNVDDVITNPGAGMAPSGSQGVLAQHSFNFANVPLSGGGGAEDESFSFAEEPGLSIGWTAQVLPEDVNGDGLVTPQDALLVVNDLNRNGVRVLTGPGTGTFFPDVDGSGTVTPLDALLVVQYLNGNDPLDFGEGESLMIADLPASDDPRIDGSALLPDFEPHPTIAGVRYLNLSQPAAVALAQTADQVFSELDRDAALTTPDSAAPTELQLRTMAAQELEDWKELDLDLELTEIAEDVSRAWRS